MCQVVAYKRLQTWPWLQTGAGRLQEVLNCKALNGKSLVFWI